MFNELQKIACVYEDLWIRKQRRKRQKILIIELFLDYAKHSTLHGLRYITDVGFTIVEKCFWAVTFLLSIALCSYLISNMYVKWRNSPVIVTVSSRFVTAGEVPFPSVTICPQIKSKATVYNYSEKVDKFNAGNITDEELQRFIDISVICGLEESHKSWGSIKNYTDSSIIDHINHVAPNSSDVLLGCIWRDNKENCTEMFKNVYTAEGLCFNMNGLAAEEMFRDTVQKTYKYSERENTTQGWTLDNGYNKDFPGEYFPKRGTENGATPDLEVYLRSKEKDTDGVCNGLNSGYKIYIQHPTDLPQSSMYYYAAIDRQVSSLAISFDLVATPQTLEHYSIEERQCFFPHDRQLHYFKVYTMKNCRAECLSNYTFEKCNCVGFHMPHTNSSRICVADNIKCMHDAHHHMAAEELRLELEKSKEGCHCLPACNTVEYEAEILKTDFHLKRYLEKFSVKLENGTNFSKIEMYFKKPRYMSMHRSELFGLTDFLANIGGLLGVFLGFSFLSLIEILYFMTVRVGFLLKRDLKEEKKTRQSIRIRGY